MIIDITQSKLFMTEPDERFSREFNLPRGMWKELWKRYILMGYTQAELREYFFIKTKRQLSEPSVCRWIIRTRIYSITAPVVKMGAKHVNSNIFGDLEPYVLKEMTKHIKSGASKNPKAVI